MSVSIRQIRAEDFAAILKINAESSPHVAKLNKEELRQQVALASIAWVATDSGRIVGYLVAMSNSAVYEGEAFRSFLATLPERFMYIDQVAVSVAARGASVASQMYARPGTSESGAGGFYLVLRGESAAGESDFDAVSR